MMIRILIGFIFLGVQSWADQEDISAIENIGGFVAGTLVHTFNGPDTIQNTRVNDRLLSFDPQTGEIVHSRVLDVHQTQVDELAEVVINGEKFYLNPDHRFYIAGTGEWVSAKELKPGDHVLLNQQGQHLEVASVKLIQERSTIYDLTVEDTQNYFVGQNQVLVHNFAFLIPIFTWVIGEGIILSAATIGLAATAGALIWGTGLDRHLIGDLFTPDRSWQPPDRVEGDKTRGGGGFNPSPMFNQGNTNPYRGPVGETVNVVDPYGNNIRVNPGEQVRGSPNGDYQQVFNSDGIPTGVRMDRGGHKTHSDPTSQGPHAHRPDTGKNDHLPIKGDR